MVDTLYVFCCVTCISYIVWLYCLKYGGFLTEVDTLYVFVVVLLVLVTKVGYTVLSLAVFSLMKRYSICCVA